jgi:hypothetical protein
VARLGTLGFVACALLSCKSATKNAPPPLPDPNATAVDPAPASLHRLSSVQYANSIHDLFGQDVVVPTALEPDVVVEGLVSIGMSQATISPTGVERYEKAALAIADQVAKRPAFAACTPTGPSDTTCFRAFVTATGPRVWRRALTDDEVTQLVAVASSAASALNDGAKGLEIALVALLESPNFLFRSELGEPDPDHAGMQRYSSLEMASRLSYFLTGSTPDDALLAAAAKGELVTDAGLRAQATRLISSPAARGAMRNFFTELYGLANLNQLSKDPNVFRAMSADLGAMARQETLLGLEKLIFDEDGDFRGFFTGHRTFVNRRLAAIYDVPAPSVDGFGEVQLPANGQRQGFFGQVSFLALQAHPTSTSAVLRGKFIRNILLCEAIPPPPVGVNTGLPPPTMTARTLRERSAAHLQQGSSCAGCHTLMDPIGLGFETFDGIGQYRTSDNGAPIDTSGQLDSVTFKGPTEIGAAVANHPNFGPCLAKNLYRYATGHVETFGEGPLVDAFGKYFVADGFRVKDLMLAIALSPGFRRAAQVTP